MTAPSHILSGETVLAGDCRDLMPARGPFDMILADPPYGDTTLVWDTHVPGWLPLARQALQPSGSMWIFGSLRFFMAMATELHEAGFRYAQEIVWEKPNGSGMAADRFKRVHELAVQFYRKDVKWRDVYNDVQRTPALNQNRSVRIQRPDRLPHGGKIRPLDYHDDGFRIVKSVIYANSVRTGVHPTEKPSALLEILIRTSCPEGGLVGDWFAGSGAAGEACRLTGRRYLGCEIDAEMADKARARIGGLLPFDGSDTP